MAGLVGHVQKPGQKTAARSRAANLAKKSANQRVTISNLHTENKCGLKFTSKETTAQNGRTFLSNVFVVWLLSVEQTNHITAKYE